MIENLEYLIEGGPLRAMVDIGCGLELNSRIEELLAMGVKPEEITIKVQAKNASRVSTT